ncbi:MAG: hypothetical protein ACK5KO_08975 [Arachnia sp.]
MTTTALGLALNSPRPVVLVEADPKGGSGLLAGFFRGQLDHPGLVDLVIAQRADLVAEALPRLLYPVEGSAVSVLFGARSHEQAAGIAALWEPLLDALRGLEATGTDVIVDAGRLGPPGWPRPLVHGADVTLLVVGSDLPSLAAARSWAAALQAEDLPGHVTRLLVVGEGRPYDNREVARTLGMPVLRSIEWAPELARVYSHGQPAPRPSWWLRVGRGPDAAASAFADSVYVRSLRAVAGSLRALPDASMPAPFRSALAQSRVLAGGRRDE